MDCVIFGSCKERFFKDIDDEKRGVLMLQFYV